LSTEQSADADRSSKPAPKIQPYRLLILTWQCMVANSNDVNDRRGIDLRAMDRVVQDVSKSSGNSDCTADS